MMTTLGKMLVGAWVVFGLFVFLYALVSMFTAVVAEDWTKATYWLLVVVAMRIWDIYREVRDAKK